LQRVPDVQQHALAIFPPLMIPKAQFLNSLSPEKFRASLIAFKLTVSSMLKSIQFNGQSREPAIKVQKVGTDRILSAEFEPSETAGFQREPELLFFFSLFTPQTPCVLNRVHASEPKDSKEKNKPRT
jgi:hypothetical protein